MTSSLATTTDTSWSPILEGALRVGAIEAVQEIAAILPRFAPTHASLVGGAAGLAVFHAYLARAGGDDGAAQTASQSLALAMEQTAATTMSPSLYSGFTGVAWAVEHLSAQLLDTGDDDPNEAVDALIVEYLKRTPWRGDYDLIIGLAGLGVYALERLPHATAVECLELVIDRLAETAERTARGVAWYTRPELLSERERELCPQGYYNLGLAHGVPGVIALLGQACAAGVARAKAEPLLEGAVAWLLAQRLPHTALSRFAGLMAPGVDAKASRLAWCYGDPGVAAALFGAARHVNEPDWERAALDLMRGAAARAPEDAGVVDAGLCHGAAGPAHIFNRFYQATGEADFKTAARHWFNKTLELRRPGHGIAGFVALERDEIGEQRWVDDPGLLTGAAGIALALLAATTRIEPEWDRMLLTAF
jgi:lantibiotic modifying enzyme